MIPVARPFFLTQPDAAIRQVLDSCWLGQGREVYAFEDDLAEHLSAPGVVAVNTGTSALELAIRNFAAKNKRLVIIPNITFVATAQAALNAGYEVLLCDSDKSTLNLCPTSLDKLLSEHSSNIAAVVNMHYGGVALSHNWYIANSKCFAEWSISNQGSFIEDAAHSIGSMYVDLDTKVKVGSDPHAISCFSFDPIKNITSIEGGAIVSSDTKKLDEIRRQRMLGIDKDSYARKANRRGWEFDVHTPGFRYHMSNVNAAVGICQLHDIEELKLRRQRVLAMYLETMQILRDQPKSSIRLAGIGTSYPERVNPFCISVMCSDRNNLSDFFRDAGIGSTVNWLALSQLNIKGVNTSSDLSFSNHFSATSLSLPMHAGMTNEDLERIKEALLSYEG